MGKGRKATKGKKTTTVKDLTAKDARAVKGGRKAGEPPVEYLKVKMTDILISG
ncbi:MAG: hypothetical protein ACREM3_05225 [Candidatus Rokuibacteriota bacterium]